MITKFDEENMTAEFTVASEKPFLRTDDENGNWQEVLVIDENAVNLDRLRDGASVLFDHDSSKIIGATEDAWITDDGKLAVRAKFRSADEKALALYKDIKEGTVRNVSIGYIVQDIQFSRSENGDRIGRVTQWEPYEVSVVGIPADAAVGFYRSLNHPVKNQPKEKRTMTDEEKKELERLQALAAEEAAAEAETETAEAETAETENTEVVENAERAIKNSAKTAKRSLARVEAVRETAPRFDIGAALRSMCDPVKFRADNERKLSDSLYRSAGFQPSSDGFMIRDFSGLGESVTGAGLVGTTHRGDMYVEILRSKLAVKEAQFLTGLVGNVSIPAQTSESGADWVSDVNADAVNTNPTVGSITLTPKKISAVATVQKDLLLSGNPDAIALVMNDLISAVDRRLDLTILKGRAASPAVQGVGTATGVKVVTLSEGVAKATYQDFLKYGAFVDQYEMNGTPRFIMSSADRQILKGISKDAGSGRYICEDNMIDGYEVGICGKLATGEIYFGDWSQILVGNWGGLEVIVNPWRLTGGKVEVTVNLYADIAVRNPQGFVTTK
jgi:HK97 family phage major capsid protein/HK97 family phage prohead protease